MTTKVTPPNIFKFATSELSQDAVLAYILAWAHPDYHKDHPKLNKLGRELLDALLKVATNDKGEKANVQINEITKLDVGTQDNRMDVSVEINDSVFLIIEDKTYTGKHSNQIDRYRGIAESLKTEGDEYWKVFAVYVKTGNESAASRPKGVGCFLRGDLLDVLNANTETGNNIIEEFRSHLQKWEDDTQSFKTTPFKSWSWKAHKGYYLALEEGLKGVKPNWCYVSNPAGGALVFWQGSTILGNKRKLKKCNIYLQIDRRKGLFVRVSDMEDDTGKEIKVNAKFLRKVLNEAKKHATALGDIQIAKPSRYGSGKSASAARIYFGKDKGEVGNAYLATNDDNTIDLDATVERLKKATELVDAILSSQSLKTSEHIDLYQ